MIIEMQLKSEILINAVRNRLLYFPICITDKFVDGNFIIDHIDFPNQATIERKSSNAIINVPSSQPVEIAASVVRVVQPAQLFIVRMADLPASGASASPPILSPIIKIYFDFTLAMDKDEPFLCVKFSGIDLGEVAEQISQNEIALIQSRIQSELIADSCSKVNLAPFGKLLDISIPVANAGMITDKAGTFVILRLGIKETGNIVQSWENFFQDEMPNLLAGNNWNVLIDKDLILPVISDRIQSTIAANNKFVLTSSLSTQWSFASGPRIDISFSGVVKQACFCLFEWNYIDVAVDVCIGISLSVPKADNLQTTVDWDWDTNPMHLACCVISPVLFWPAPGLAYQFEGKIGWGEFWGGLAGGPLVLLVGAILAVLSQGPGEMDFKKILKDATCIKQSEKRIICTQPIQLGSGLIGEMGTAKLTEIAALPEGLSLGGSLQLPIGHYGVAEAKIEDVFPFSWGILGSCSKKDFRISCAAGFIITNIGMGPLSICEIEILDDPLEQYKPYVKVTWQPYERHWPVAYIVVEPWGLKNEFLKDPYPCKMLIKTNGGVREIIFDPPKPISQDEKNALEMEGIRVKAECYEAIDSFFAATGLMNPKWIPDPPPDAVDMHLWQIFITGLEPGTDITALDEARNIIVAAHADERGIVRFDALTGPAKDPEKELMLLNSHVVQSTNADKYIENSPFAGDHDANAFDSSSIPIPRNNDRRMVFIKQIQLIERALISLSHPCDYLQKGLIKNKPVILAVSDGEVTVYSIRRPKLPQLFERFSSEGVRGAMVWRDEYILWGEFGLIFRTRSGDQLHLISSPVRDLIQVSQYIAALSDDGIKIFDSNFRQVSQIPIAGAKCLSTTNRWLIAAKPNRLELFDIEQPLGSNKSIEIRSASTAELSPNHIIGHQKGIFIRKMNGGGIEYDLESKDHEEAVHHQSDPWFVSSIQIGRVLARLDAERNKIILYEIGCVHTI